MRLGVQTITKDPVTGLVTALGGKLNLEGDVKKTRLKLTWLAAVPQCEVVPLQLLDFDHLITKRKVSERICAWRSLLYPESNCSRSTAVYGRRWRRTITSWTW